MTFAVYLATTLRGALRDVEKDARHDLASCREELREAREQIRYRDEQIRELERTNARLMRRISLRNGDNDR
jgi:hypothetical protein